MYSPKLIITNSKNSSTIQVKAPKNEINPSVKQKEKEELWKRTVVVFTTIDELKGCDSYEDRVNKLETQIAKPGYGEGEKINRPD